MNDAITTNKPQSLTALFLAFNWMSLQGFGGVLVIAQREICDKLQWMTREQFAEDWAVAQVMPGPNIVNLGLQLGDRYFGWRGAFTAVAGLLSVPLLLALVLLSLYSHFAALAIVAGAVKGMGAAAAGMIAAVGFKLFASIKTSPVGKAVFTVATLATFSLVIFFKLPLAWTIPVVGLPSCIWTYWRMTRMAKKTKGSV